MRFVILDISMLVCMARSGVLCNTAAMDYFASSGWMDVNSAVTMNETIISSSYIFRGLSFSQGIVVGS